ncbi:exodeoxyribonuclease VII small subunit [Aliifodinibius salipaludis]|uniref:Exodeoxyribonuclease 7 small subunit n=1 Tax=Fodinibius salipaludis TaxID=2032627 RepID=A0A2A2GEH3_9BACT|nr:exodeoxyribonuclease VII small subunit [Aliifodinibius salipaludis]PAU95265.1 exodeoxyribonuclease VII small subunit [Aliifodinibius salipaludis]
MPEKERPSFEEALKRLEDIVNQLEDESISLEKSIALYEEGIKLSKICTETLEEAELRIKKVADQHNDDNEKT